MKKELVIMSLDNYKVAIITLDEISLCRDDFDKVPLTEPDKKDSYRYCLEQDFDIQRLDGMAKSGHLNDTNLSLLIYFLYNLDVLKVIVLVDRYGGHMGELCLKMLRNVHNYEGSFLSTDMYNELVGMINRYNQ